MAEMVGINDEVFVNNNITVSQIVFGVQWQEGKEYPDDMIMDIVMFGLDEDSRCVNNRDIFFFFNPELSTERDEVIRHRVYEDIIENNGKEERDKEQIFLLLDEIPLRYKKLLFSVVVFEEEGKEEKGHILSKSEGLHPHIFNYETGETILEHAPYGNDFFLRETCMVLGELRRDESDPTLWSYRNISQAFLGNMGTLFGIYLEENRKEEV